MILYCDVEETKPKETSLREEEEVDFGNSRVFWLTGSKRKCSLSVTKQIN